MSYKLPDEKDLMAMEKVYPIDMTSKRYCWKGLCFQ